jgi:hypothetical protein
MKLSEEIKQSVEEIEMRGMQQTANALYEIIPRVKNLENKVSEYAKELIDTNKAWIQERNDRKATLTKEQSGWLEFYKNKEFELDEVWEVYAHNKTPFDGPNGFNEFARAWLYGYKLEKEKRYEVKMPSTESFLVKDIKHGDNYFYFTDELIQPDEPQHRFTMDEIPKEYRQFAVEVQE